MGQSVRPLPISVQVLNLKRLFPETKVINVRDQQLVWTHTITPSPMGELYKVKLVYNLTEPPKIFVVEPKPLHLAQGKSSLPHCYEQKQQQLCLYLPNSGEWNKSMLLTATIIPWTFEWLYHYEIWLGTGEWHGGGIHNISQAEKQKLETKKSNESDKK